MGGYRLLTESEAEIFYRSIDKKFRYAHYNPGYVIADAIRENSKPIFFLYEKNDNWYYHAFHIKKIEEIGLWDVQSPYGYGGAISNSLENEFIEKALAHYHEWCIENKILVEFIRFHPVLRNDLIYRGNIFFDRNTINIDITKENLFETYNARTRRTIRKAQRNGLYVEWVAKETFLNVFPALYDELMNKINANKFYLFKEKYFEKIVEVEGTLLGLCKKENEILSGAIFLTNGENMEYHLSASNDKGKKYAATSFLIDKATEKCQEMGILNFHLGGGTNNLKDNDLYIYKKGFSNLECDFFIGGKIYNKNLYEEYKSYWNEKNSENINNKILFYRFGDE